MATSNEAEKARHALRRRRRLRQVLGAVVCVLVVIGLASVISGGVRLTASLFDDTEEKRGIRTAAANACLAGPGAF